MFSNILSALPLATTHHLKKTEYLLGYYPPPPKKKEINNTSFSKCQNHRKYTHNNLRTTRQFAYLELRLSEVL
jgi:hypothetical protein